VRGWIEQDRDRVKTESNEALEAPRPIDAGDRLISSFESDRDDHVVRIRKDLLQAVNIMPLFRAR